MRAVFGGIIAVVLLGIYVYLIYEAYVIVDCASSPGCEGPLPASFTAQMAQVLGVVGGLVSALVIAELAITDPGEAPAGRMLAGTSSTRSVSVLKWISGAYVVVWLVAGLAAFMKGISHPDVLPVLTTVGQSWFGLAVAAAYAYFGLTPR